jgi:type III secretion system (T3SS) SseB-like protein
MPWLRRRGQKEFDPNAELLVLADESNGTGTFDTLQDDDGNVFLVAFTSPESLRRGGPEGASSTPFIGHNVLAMLLETDCAGIVIDAGSKDTFVISRAAAEQFAGPSYDTLWAGPSVLVAEPDEPLPATMVRRLQDVCAQDRDVASAYFFLAAAPGYESFPQPVLGLNLSSGDEVSDDLMAAFMDSHGPVAEFIETYPNLDVHILDDDLRDVVVQHGVLIYERTVD